MKLNRVVKLLSAIVYLGVFFLSDNLYAQQKVVKAKVVDASDGGPLIGVVVSVKSNIKNSVVSDKKGEFTIRAQNNDILVFSYIGFESQEILVSTFKSLEVKLKPAAESLNEVVVVAYGKQERKDLTGSVGIVKMDDLTKSPVISFDQALQGRVAGVSMSSNDGQLGEDMNIVIRGANSVTQNNSPLYVIDGFPTEDFSAATINPNDIASISILKDASATAIYGSRGANGVVIIETKSGKTGKVKLSFSNSFGIQDVVKTMDVMDPYNYVKYMLELNPNSEGIFLTPEGLALDDYKKKPAINWQDQLFRTAPMQNHYVSMSGGTQQTKYWVSGSIADQKGVIDHSSYTRYNGQIRLDQKISKKLSVDMNLSYSSDRTLGAVASELSESGPQSQQYQSYLMFRVWGYRPVLVGQTSYDDMFEDVSSLSSLNPIMSNANDHREVGKNNLRLNAKLQYQILPALSLVIRGGVVQTQTETDLFNNSRTYSGFPSANNSRGVNGSYNLFKRKELLGEGTLEYKKAFNRDHSISLLSGFSMQSYDVNRKGHTVWQIPYEEFGMAGLVNGRPNSVVSIIDENRLMSAFARVNYSYKSKYVLTSTLRADGSSKFSRNNRWGIFPSVAASWNMNKEKFMESLSFIDEAKLRASWGVTGNNRIDSYAARGTMGVGEYTSFNNGTPLNSATILSLENDKLSWEETSQVNLGYDLSLFRNRIALTFDVYRKTSNNLLLNADVPFSTGQAKAYRNVGSVRNDGVEIGLNVVNISNKNFKWSSDFNISFNGSKVLGLNDGQEKLFSSVKFTGDFNTTNLYVTEVGAPITSFYGLVYDGVYQVSDFDFKYGKYELKPSVPANGVARENIQPGDPRFIDLNGDGNITDADNTRIGRALPIHSGGFNNNFDYKNWSLNVFFQWNYGNMIMNANRIALEGNYQNIAINQYASYINRWSEDNQISNIPRTRAQGPTGFYSSRTLEDGSYLRLKTVQLSYKLPKKLLKSLNIANVGLNIACQNLFTWSNYSGIDPEVSVRNSTLTTGFDYSAYARNRIITAGLKLDF